MNLFHKSDSCKMSWMAFCNTPMKQKIRELPIIALINAAVALSFLTLALSPQLQAQENNNENNDKAKPRSKLRVGT